jgi:hypothetical protein
MLAPYHFDTVDLGKHTALMQPAVSGTDTTATALEGPAAVFGTLGRGGKSGGEMISFLSGLRWRTGIFPLLGDSERDLTEAEADAVRGVARGPGLDCGPFQSKPLVCAEMVSIRF